MSANGGQIHYGVVDPDFRDGNRSDTHSTGGSGTCVLAGHTEMQWVAARVDGRRIQGQRQRVNVGELAIHVNVIRVVRRIETVNDIRPAIEYDLSVVPGIVGAPMANGTESRICPVTEGIVERVRSAAPPAQHRLLRQRIHRRIPNPGLHSPVTVSGDRWRGDRAQVMCPNITACTADKLNGLCAIHRIDRRNHVPGGNEIPCDGTRVGPICQRSD